MPLKVPKIVYDPGSGDVTLAFAMPPIKKPGEDELQAESHVTIASAGPRQVITERVDVFRDVEIDFVPLTDLAAWKAFMQYAVEGKSFKYYPDSTAGAFEEWTLEDDKWKPTYGYRDGVKTIAKFKFRMRKLVP